MPRSANAYLADIIDALKLREECAALLSAAD